MVCCTILIVVMYRRDYKLKQVLLFCSRSDTVVKLTHEQLRIVNHNVQAGEVIKIIAFAGELLVVAGRPFFSTKVFFFK